MATSTNTTTTNGSSNGKQAVASTTPAATDDNKAVQFYSDPEHLAKLCNFLRSGQGPPVREALLMEKRVHYLKGEKLVNFMFEPRKGTKWPKTLPRFAKRHDAIAVCKELCKQHFLVRSDKHGKGELALSRVRDFDEAGYFTWVYEGDKTKAHLMTTALIIGCLFCVCFPIWPQFLRVFVWYLSVSFLLFTFLSITIRAFIFLMIWIVGYEFWILPNLFDETLNFADSFKPLYSFEATKPGQLPYRLGVGVAFFSFCWWAVTQPSEFDGFVSAQKDFLADLYEGKLLSDISQTDKVNIDKPKMQSLDDLLKSLDSELEEENNIIHDLDDLDDEDKLDSLLDNLVDADEHDDADEEE